MSTKVDQKAVIINSQNQILVLKRSEKSSLPGKWSLPGGAIETGEDPYQAIQREIREETTLEVNNLYPFDLKSYINKNGDFCIIIGYKADYTTGQVELNGEHSEYKWMNIEMALELDLGEDGRFFITSHAKWIFHHLYRPDN